MALSIKDPEADRIARELAQETGESITEAVLQSLKERLERKKRQRKVEVDRRVAAAMEVVRHAATLPILDPRSPDEILGYDENGLPT
jgi:antitoxin VapB